MKSEGYYNVKPTISKLTFLHKGMFDIHLRDGRVISVPLSQFPEVKSLKPSQLKKWYIINDSGFSFDDCNEVYHIEQVLGNYDSYKYDFVSDPSAKYLARKKKV